MEAVTFDGGGDAADAIRRAVAELEAAGEDALRDEAEAVADDERALVPVDSGDGQASIRAMRIGQFEWVIGPDNPDVYYLVWVEWGRKSAPAQPFATPAAETSRRRYPVEAAATIKKAVR